MQTENVLESETAESEETLEPWHQCIVTKPNEFMLPENAGKDAVTATCDEFPGVAAIGPNIVAATRQFKKVIREIIESAGARDRQRIETTQALVQFNHRITVSEKIRITERAKKAGLSVRQFVLNQCLYAPELTTGPEMPNDQKREILRKVKLPKAAE